MKKLIAIAVVFALVTVVAFADTTVGGQVFVAGTLLQGTDVKDSDIGNSAIETDVYNTAVKITFSEGDAGGRIRILANGPAFDEAFGWWRPIPQLRIQIGTNQDGDFGTANISGWGFTGENKNNSGNQGAMAEYGSSNYNNMANEGRNHSRTIGWYGGTGATPNLQFSIFPAEGLTINIWFPWNALDVDGKIVGLTLAKFNAQVQYAIPDIGTASLSFESDTGYLKPDADAWSGAKGVTNAVDSKFFPNSPKVFASFYLTAIEGMGVDIGLAYALPFNNTDSKIVTNYPFEIGLGFRYGSGDFNFKLRASASLGASTVYDGTETDASKYGSVTQISASILPSYKIGTVTVFFYAGLGIESIADWEKAGTSAPTWATANKANTNVAWFVNPYVFIPAGGLRFKVGFQLSSNGTNAATNDDKPIVNWAIPFGFYTYF